MKKLLALIMLYTACGQAMDEPDSVDLSQSKAKRKERIQDAEQLPPNNAIKRIPTMVPVARSSSPTALQSPRNADLYERNNGSYISRLKKQTGSESPLITPRTSSLSISQIIAPAYGVIRIVWPDETYELMDGEIARLCEGFNEQQVVEQPVVSEYKVASTYVTHAVFNLFTKMLTHLNAYNGDIKELYTMWQRGSANLHIKFLKASFEHSTLQELLQLVIICVELHAPLALTSACVHYVTLKLTSNTFLQLYITDTPTAQWLCQALTPQVKEILRDSLALSRAALLWGPLYLGVRAQRITDPGTPPLRRRSADQLQQAKLTSSRLLNTSTLHIVNNNNQNYILSLKRIHESIDSAIVPDGSTIAILAPHEASTKSRPKVRFIMCDTLLQKVTLSYLPFDLALGKIKLLNNGLTVHLAEINNTTNVIVCDLYPIIKRLTFEHVLLLMSCELYYITRQPIEFQNITAQTIYDSFTELIIPEFFYDLPKALHNRYFSDKHKESCLAM